MGCLDVIIAIIYAGLILMKIAGVATLATVSWPILILWPIPVYVVLLIIAVLVQAL